MNLLATLAQAAPTEEIVPSGSDAQLIIAAVAGFAVIILLITWAKLHPFLSLAIGAIGVGLAAGLPAATTISSFAGGFGNTMRDVGLLIGFGAMYGKLLADSGGADRVVDTLVSRASARTLPWMMGLVGAVIGLPMFFEIGLVLLMPVIILVARRSGVSLMRIAIPTLAGLSAMHGLVPPHPGPLSAVGTLGANLGLTLGLGVLVAIPTVIIAGPLFSTYAARWAPVSVPDMFTTDDEDPNRKRPSFAATLISILLPVVLMLARSLSEVLAPDSESWFMNLLNFLGTPVIALGLAVLVGIGLLGVGGGMQRDAVSKSLESSLGPIGGILLIVGAGGGFKQVLIDTGIGTMISRAVADSGFSVLILAWVVAVLIRVATGSATVATVTTAGIMQSVAETLSTGTVSLLVLAIGSGSLFLSHVNDAGFWLVKQYTGTTVKQNLKTWSVMESLISVVGLVFVMILSIFVG